MRTFIKLLILIYTINISAQNEIFVQPITATKSYQGVFGSATIQIDDAGSDGLITNPLIVACFMGGIFSLFNLHLPNIIDKTLVLLISAALPLGLFSVGVGLHLSAIKENKSAVILSSMGKLILFPTIMYIICNIFSVEKEIMILLVMFASIPTASSAYAFARQLGGDLKLMSSIISIQTILSIFTISFFIWLLKIG